MLEILLSQEYGYMPPTPDRVHFSVAPPDKQFRTDATFCAGKASHTRIVITSEMKSGSYSFPISVVVPTTPGPHPFFVHINFRPNVPDIYMPTEELVDGGFGVISFNYEDVAPDDASFDKGLSAILYPCGRQSTHDCGKLGMWAWAASRAMDYAETNPLLDKSCAVVCGHSRLGKTALLAAATDTRFTHAYANGSGCSGSCITRQKNGERVAEICTSFPAWHCGEYRKYAHREEDMPFDQHYLVAAIAPRFVAIGSDDDGPLSDATADMLTCIAASPMYEAMGREGFVYDGNPPCQGAVWHEGSIGYHVRKGLHYFDRYDWNMLMSFVKKHRK